MIVGLGVDIVDQQRIQGGIEKLGERFLSKIFTAQECQLCQQYQSPFARYAGKFAAKEAFLKAVGHGLFQIPLPDIAVLNQTNGAPYLHLTGKAAALINQLAVTQTFLTISHDKQMAVAVVVLERI